MCHSVVNRPLTVLVVLLGLLSFTACDDVLGERGTGDLLTETRNETDFHALEIATPGTVEVRVDSVFKIEVTCEESILPYLETEVENGVLKIHFDRNVYDVDGFKVRVSAPSWDGFDISGSADVNVKTPISGDQLSLKVSGSGDIDVFEAAFSTTKINVSGSGEIDLNGSGETLDVTVSGSGDVDALDFPVKTAKATVSGSGDVKLDVSDTLDATISGSGDIEYQGSPTVTKNVSGSGNVRKI